MVEESISYLKNLIHLFKVNSNIKITIEGHTDNIPIRTKEYQSNWELSAHRATNVVKYFISKGIEKKRIKAIAMADSHPLYPNFKPSGAPNAKNQAKNRRIEIYIHRNFK